MNPDIVKPLSKSIVTQFTQSTISNVFECSEKKQKDNKELQTSLMKWNSNLREGLIKSGSNKSTYHQKWGRFVPAKRLNVDQVPLPFAINVTQTYEVPVPKEEKRHHRV